jgi:UDP-N-acetyl-D-mannosaminuronic acid transferase (WecB/TagA/CpsF family)
MSRIHHYSNLVCWREIHQLTNAYSETKHFIYLDSISIRMAAFIFCGKRLPRSPGSSVLSDLNSLSGNKNISFLTSGTNQNNLLPNVKLIPLPFSEDVNYIYSSVANKIENTDIIFTGISSPKQNELACLIVKENPEVEVFCLGASLDDIFDSKKSLIIHRFSRFGLEWLIRLKMNPKRFYTKLYHTLRNFLIIALNGKCRSLFHEHIASVVNK